MKVLAYELRFTTPAFLGNADQSGQWRTPPIKALIRQWWRVAYGCRRSRDWQGMRREEGRLFGNAWLEENRKPLHCKSSIRLRLEPSWSPGTLSSQRWPNDFARVQTTRTGGSLPADLYLGYGPIQRTGGKTTTRIAIEPAATARLRVLLPCDCSKEIDKSLTLLQWFGAVGSRSRNGWGSIHLVADGETPALPALNPSDPLLKEVSQDWRKCHQLDWPHAIGCDDRGPLIWRTEDFGDWRKAIGALANVRLAVRRVAKTIRNPNGRAAALHYLGYPAGTGPKNPWALDVAGERDKLRLASPLRFKVVPADGEGRVRGLAFHIPCAVPTAFLGQLRNASDRDWLADPSNLQRAWEAIHRTLNEDLPLSRIGT